MDLDEIQRTIEIVRDLPQRFEEMRNEYLAAANIINQQLSAKIDEVSKNNTSVDLIRNQIVEDLNFINRSMSKQVIKQAQGAQSDILAYATEAIDGFNERMENLENALSEQEYSITLQNQQFVSQKIIELQRDLRKDIQSGCTNVLTVRMQKLVEDEVGKRLSFSSLWKAFLLKIGIGKTCGTKDQTNIVDG